MEKVKGQTEVKLGEKQPESYLDPLLPQLESLLHNSNCSGLPRPVNGVKVTQRSKSLDGSGPLLPNLNLS